MRFAPFVIAVLLLPAVPPLAAQEPPIKVGDRVRFWRQQTLGVTEGTIAGWEADSFAITDNWIPITSVTRLEARRPKYSRGARVALGAGGGLLGGALSGALLGFAVCSGESYSGSFCTDRGAGAAIGAVAFGGAGLVLGAIHGLFASIDRWEEVPLDRVRVSFGPQPDGRFGLGASVRF